jgi:hypothetical protein
MISGFSKISGADALITKKIQLQPLRHSGGLKMGGGSSLRA